MHCSLTQVISSKKRNLFIILKHLFPKAVISHRSAFEFQSTPGGHIFLTYSYIRNIFLPGVTVHLMEGQGECRMIPHLSKACMYSGRRGLLGKTCKYQRKKGTNPKRFPAIQHINVAIGNGKSIRVTLGLCPRVMKIRMMCWEHFILYRIASRCSRFHDRATS